MEPYACLETNAQEFDGAKTASKTGPLLLHFEKRCDKHGSNYLSFWTLCYCKNPSISPGGKLFMEGRLFLEV